MTAICRPRRDRRWTFVRFVHDEMAFILFSFWLPRLPVQDEPGRDRPRDADHHVAVGRLLFRRQDRIPVIGNAREDGRLTGAADPLRLSV